MRPRKPKASKENETLAERKARLELGSRGKSAETKVFDILSKWQKAGQNSDFDRLLDSRSAGRIVAAQVADFLLFFQGSSATLEVKEIKKGSRLTKKSFPQLPRMVRRELTGCKGFLIAHTKEDDKWRVVRVANMALGAPSWKLSEVGVCFANVESAMNFVRLQITEVDP